MQLRAVDRISFLYAEKGYLEADGHALVLAQGEQKIHFPVGAANVILVMPGTVVTHAAAKICGEEKCLLLWVGENGVRLYSAGYPGGAVAGHLLRQAAIRLNDQDRLAAAKRGFYAMFGEKARARTIEELRGEEGARVKALYAQIASDHGVIWTGRNTSAGNDPVNQAISAANAALYGLAEAVILALGYSPAIGFSHSGDTRSFVFDVADCLKFKTVVPLGMQIAAESSRDIQNRTRRACRDLFVREGLTRQIVAAIDLIIPPT